MPLRRPFRTSFGTQTSRDILLVRVEGVADGAATIGWGECVAMDEPRYSAEYVAGAAGVAPLLAVFEGHPMAKAALEMAVLDAELRVADRSFAEHLGAVRDRVP